MKVYSKRGNTNYKEKRLIKQIQSSLEKKGIDEIEPARSFEELQSLFNEHCVENAEELPITEETINTDLNEPTMTEKEPPIEEQAPETSSSPKADKVSDPLNRSEPIIRDYVLDNYNDPNTDGQSSQTEFAEPTDFKDAFHIPTDEETEEVSVKPESSSETSAQETPPVNPSFSEMDTKKAKKKSLRFAKQVVNLVCDLAERGFIFWTTKDITESKLAEYEMNGEMDLSLLVELADGQEVAIKQFFANQCLLSEQESKVSEEDRAELVESLAEVFMEKGIAPTPAQELMLVSAKVFGIMFIKGMTIQKQNAAILDQLREQNGPGQDLNEVEVDQPSSTETGEPQVSEEASQSDLGRSSRRARPSSFDELDTNLQTY